MLVVRYEPSNRVDVSIVASTCRLMAGSRAKGAFTRVPQVDQHG